MRGGGSIFLLIAFLATGSIRIETVHHHGIILTITVQVHGPHELGAVVITVDDGVVEVKIKPYVGV